MNKKEVTTASEKKAVWLSVLKVLGKILVWLGREILNLFYEICFKSTKAKTSSEIDSDIYLKKNALFKLVVIDPSERKNS